MRAHLNTVKAAIIIAAAVINAGSHGAADALVRLFHDDALLSDGLAGGKAVDQLQYVRH